MSRGGRLSAAGPDARQPPLSAPGPSNAPGRVGARRVAPLTREQAGAPVRTCVGCRAHGLRSALLRVVAVVDGAGSPALVVDVDRRMPGRGAWLHPDRGCLELATRRRAFGRALRLQGAPDVTDVVAQLERQITVPGGPAPTVDEGSGLEADGDPMSTHR